MKRISDGRMQMTMTWHIKKEKAKEQRDRFEEGTKHLGLRSTYHVVRSRFLWKVVKKFFVHDTGNQILGSSKKG